MAQNARAGPCATSLPNLARKSSYRLKRDRLGPGRFPEALLPDVNLHVRRVMAEDKIVDPGQRVEMPTQDRVNWNLDAGPDLGHHASDPVVENFRPFQG